MRRLAAAMATIAVCAFVPAPAHAAETTFDDPIGDGGSASMDLTRYRVSYTDDGGRVLLRFVDLTHANFDSIIWYVNRRGPGIGQLGIVAHNDGTYEDIGDRDCDQAHFRIDRARDIAVLKFPTSCVTNAARIRVLVGIEGRSGEDWNDTFSEPVER